MPSLIARKDYLSRNGQSGDEDSLYSERGEEGRQIPSEPEGKWIVSHEVELVIILAEELRLEDLCIGLGKEQFWRRPASH